MTPIKQGLAAALLCAAAGTVYGSSHREALAVLNEPWADNTDTYAWVSNGSHDKLYLIMNFNPLHEPGQGNQGLRACNGYRYEFHIGKGTSLADRIVYRVEFKNTLPLAKAPGPNDPLGGGNELLWQLTGGTETLTVTRVKGSDFQNGPNDVALVEDVPVLPNNHGPQTDRLVYGLGAFKGYDSGDPTSREVGLYDQAFVDKYIHKLSNGGRVIAGQFDDPYQLDEKGIFDLVNLGRADLGGISGARKGPIRDVFTGYNVFSIALEIPMTDIFPQGIPHNGQGLATATDSLLRVWASISRQRVQMVDAGEVITGVKGSGDWVQVGRNALPLFNAGLVGTQRHTTYLRSNPMKDVSNFGADILFPVLVRDLDGLGVYKALGVPDSPGLVEIFTSDVPFQNAVISKLHPNLSFIPRGKSHDLKRSFYINPAQWLQLKAWARDYDYVVFDSAPTHNYFYTARAPCCERDYASNEGLTPAPQFIFNFGRMAEAWVPIMASSPVYVSASDYAAVPPAPSATTVVISQ